MRNYKIHRLGTIDLDIVEATPIVFKGKLLRFEYIREQYYGNTTDGSYFRFVDMTSGAVGKSFGHNFHMGSAFVWNERIYVSCISKWGGSEFFIMSSDDLINWSTPKLILSNPKWQGFNTSICRAKDGFVMVFELGAPKEIVGSEVFTMFFAYSKDLENWEVIPNAIYGKDVYCGAPMLRYFGDYYYFFHLSGSYEAGFNTCVARSKNLIDWSEEKLVLPFDDCDRKLIFEATTEQKTKIEQAININASDLDMCEFEGVLHLTYSWGSQSGQEFLSLGEVDCTEEEFCQNFWR